MVEQLGTGIMRITAHYGQECFRFSENFIRMVFPAAGKVPMEATKDKLGKGLVDSQKKILKLVEQNLSISKREMAKRIGISTTAIDKNIKR